MNKQSIVAIALGFMIAALAGALISCAAGKRPEPERTEDVQSTDRQPDANPCPTPKADTAKPGAGFGRDSATVGQLAEPVTAKVRVYPAAAEAPIEAKARIPAGTWLLPEEMLDKPY